MTIFSISNRRGTTLAGVFSVALGCVLLLCGAGPAFIENFRPQGPMQADLNAGGHNLTNAATVSAANVIVSGSLTAPALGSLAALSPTGTASSSTYLRGDDSWALVPGGYTLPAATTTTLGGIIVPASGGLTVDGAGHVSISVVPWATISGAPAFITSSGAPVQSVAGRTGAITLSASDISGLAASATTDTTNASNITSGTIAAARVATLNQNTTGNAATATTASAVPLSGITGLGTGVQTALGNVTNAASGPLTYNASSILPEPLQTGPTPNSVVIILGESLAVGYPIVTEGSNQQAASYIGPGKCWAQWLSALPGWTTTPVYDYGISSSYSNAGGSILSTATYGCTEYLNGSVVGGYSGTAHVPSYFVPSVGSGGTAYFINTYDGWNDWYNGNSVSTYGSNMASLWATERGYGSNVKIVGITSQFRINSSSGGTNAINNVAPYNSWTRSQLGLSTGIDYLADMTPSFIDASDTNFYYSDGIHLISAGCLIYATKISNAILNKSEVGANTSQLWVLDQQNYPTQAIDWLGNAGRINLYNNYTQQMGFYPAGGYNLNIYTASNGTISWGQQIGNGSNGSSGTFTSWASLTSSIFNTTVPIAYTTTANCVTGSGSAALGSNCPATTATTPYRWLKMKTDDGSVVYVPAWK